MAARDPENKYYPGRWLFYCDVCNRKMLSCDAKKRWDGLYVCKEDWEPRHPSDFIRARKETSNQLPWSRPGPNDTANVAPIYSDQYIQLGAGLNQSDLAYDSTGSFYWYDTVANISSTPESYVQGDYY